MTNTPLNKVRVLIVDASAFMRKVLESILISDPQLQVIGHAKDGREAIALAESLKPDVVTMDITMPQMDGIECIEKLVALKPAVRILVISALADKATAVEAMEKGANGFLNKPFTDRQLNEAIEDLMR